MKTLIVLMLLAASPAYAQFSGAGNGIDENTPQMQGPASDSPTGTRIVRRAPKPPPPKPAEDAAAPKPADPDTAAKPPTP